jgi:hypothetical protein
MQALGLEEKAMTQGSREGTPSVRGMPDNSPPMDPFRGAIPWSVEWVRRHLTGVVVGYVVIPFVGAFAGAVLAPSTTVATIVHPPSPLSRAATAGEAAGITLGGVIVLSFLAALVVAPYQQRNELRRRIISTLEHQNAIEAKTANKRVKKPHFEELKAMVTRLIGSVNSSPPQRCAYADPRKDPIAIAGHFPDLPPMLRQWDEAVDQLNMSILGLRTECAPKRGSAAS